MFIISLTYTKSIEAIEKELANHSKFLDKYYSLGLLICSGRKQPRTGGVIISKSTSREDVEKMISEDPFYKNQLAEYELIELIPTKYAPEFEPFLANKKS
jgi:uncharacterized protein YciI